MGLALGLGLGLGIGIGLGLGVGIGFGLGRACMTILDTSGKWQMEMVGKRWCSTW